MSSNDNKQIPEGRESAAAMTKDQLWEIEKSRSASQRATDFVIALLPLLCCAIALCEYLLIDGKYDDANQHKERYVILLVVPIVIYAITLLVSLMYYRKGNTKRFAKVRYSAPFISVIYLLLTALDYSTLKTGVLMYPFIPWVNDVINAAIAEREQLLTCTLFTLGLLMRGYFGGVFLGLITGVAAGYSERVRYWVNPVVKVLGPIPTATWIPLIMLLAKSLSAGSAFIVGLGAWFAVTVAAMTGISNVDKDYYDAARTLGAHGHQLIFRIAIPHAMPSILQGMTQGMSSACVSLMIAEMMGVKAGLGWYITWVKSWAAYNKMFAAIIIICIIFNIVTKALDLTKNYILRWQVGVTK